MADERNERFISAYSTDDFENAMAESARAGAITARRSGSGAPTIATVGAVGDLYTDISSGALYHCSNDSNGIYAWELVGTINKLQINGVDLSTTGTANIPPATSSVYGVTKVGVSDGAAAYSHTHSTATSATAGFMSASDKVKLNGIAAGATAVTESTVSSWGFTKTGIAYVDVSVESVQINNDATSVSVFAPGVTAENWLFTILKRAWPQESWSNGAIVIIRDYTFDSLGGIAVLSTNTPQTYQLSLRVFYRN